MLCKHLFGLGDPSKHLNCLYSVSYITFVHHIMVLNIMFNVILLCKSTIMQCTQQISLHAIPLLRHSVPHPKAIMITVNTCHTFCLYCQKGRHHCKHSPNIELMRRTEDVSKGLYEYMRPTCMW